MSDVNRTNCLTESEKYHVLILYFVSKKNLLIFIKCPYIFFSQKLIIMKWKKINVFLFYLPIELDTFMI